jgi:hypothetical protein
MKRKTVKQVIDELKKFPEGMEVQLLATVESSEVVNNKKDDGRVWEWNTFFYNEWEYNQEFDGILFIETSTRFQEGSSSC